MGFFSTSIGRKLTMAVSGSLLMLFLLAHTLGVGSSLLGKKYFVGYVTRIHSLGPLLHLLQSALAVLFLVHIFFGIRLYIDNLAARPVRASRTTASGGRTPGSRTMVASGLFLFFFLLFHLFHFAFSSQPSVDLTARLVLATPANAVLYLAAYVALGLHISHGLWSMCHSLGIAGADKKIRPAGYVATAISLVFVSVTLAAFLCRTFLV